MAEKNTFRIKDGVSVSEDVVAIVAGLAATEVEGVDSLTGNITNQAVAKTGAGKLGKGVRIKANPDGNLTIDLSIIIKFGYEIPTICGKVQEKVQNAIQNMTGINVNEVNIKIDTVTR